jgi:large subunit ribosomal protein L30
MIAVIRISGLVEVPREAQETMFRMRLRRKYSCVVLQETSENLGMIDKVKNFVAYGKIKQEDFKELIEKRGQPVNRKKKIEVFELGKGKFEDYNLKPFFRLHPPRGGIDSKTHYPRGVLGSHGEKINELLRRML